MSSKPVILSVLASALLSGVMGSTAAGQDQGFGTITGQFVLDGELPEPKVLIKQGDTSIKDAAVCSAETLYDERLVVHPASKGIANIFVYTRRVTTIHPDLAESAEKEIVFDQEGCRFIPHLLLVRTDQTVIVKSNDDCQHNTHTVPFRNDAVNFIMGPKDREGREVTYTQPEIFPTMVKCDIHPWMQAYWLILDHPYAAITDQEGKFTIEKVPAGEHDFIVWQERSGFLSAGEKRGFKVAVEDGQTVDIGVIEVPMAEFNKEF